ncbi:MAG: DNA replication/repair protein RecF [Chloroflexi bacterium]|nr:DNA replication/repair protein RecF [Chloroflexota bacterium]
MHLFRLTLANFRNYAALDLSLGPGLNLFTGPNAAGKSNLLEAVALLSAGRSPRAGADREMLRHGAWVDPIPFWRVAGEARSGEQATTIEVVAQFAGDSASGPEPALRRAQKRILVNRVARRATQLVGLFPTVLFSPTEVELVSGPPGLRRHFLDMLGCQLDPAYLRALQEYQRVLPQRNQLLRLMREGRAQEDELAFWDERLVANGARLMAARQESIRGLEPLAREALRELSKGSEALQLRYLPALDHAGGAEDDDEGLWMERLGAALATGRRREMAAGATLAGPHRDDLALLLDGVDAAVYASRGQQRCLALGLKVAEAGLLEAQHKRPPVLLLDDILSELDQERRRRLMGLLAGARQTLLTTAEPEALAGVPTAGAARYRVEGDTVVAAP